MGFNYDEEVKNWKWEIPEKYNIGYDCVDKHAEGKNKNKVALFWENEEGKAEKYTFLEMKNLSNKFGNVLRSLGLKKGDRFLMRLPNIPQFQIVFIGGVKIGAVPIPSSTMFKGHEVEYRINDSAAVAVVTTPAFVKEVEEIMDKCPTLKHVIVVGEPQNEKQLPFDELMKSASRNLVLEDTLSTDMAFFCYTSGTTGMPKGAVHLHRWVIGNDPGSIYWQAYKDDDIVAHTGQLNWIYPLGNGFLYAWRHGVSTFIYEGKFDPESWFQLLEKYQITTLDSVPTAYRMFLTVKDAEKRYDLSALRHCISAGEPLNPEVIQEWKRRFGLEIYDGIGMTEVMVYLSNMPGLEIRPGSCGKPQPGHKCAIVDSEGRVLPPGEEGTLAVSADDPGLFKEYWNKPDKTAECFKNGWFLSGDILSYDEDGYFWFRGRGDDLIKASGYRISPFEVESTLIEHPAVLEAAAVASPDEMRGNVVKAFIVLKPGYKPTEQLAKEIQEFAKEHSAPYKYPRLIEFVKELPKTQSGKIKRKELREKEFAKVKKDKKD